MIYERFSLRKNLKLVEVLKKEKINFLITTDDLIAISMADLISKGRPTIITFFTLTLPELIGVREVFYNGKWVGMIEMLGIINQVVLSYPFRVDKDGECYVCVSGISKEIEWDYFGFNFYGDDLDPDKHYIKISDHLNTSQIQKLICYLRLRESDKEKYKKALSFGLFKKNSTVENLIKERVWR